MRSSEMKMDFLLRNRGTFTFARHGIICDRARERKRPEPQLHFDRQSPEFLRVEERSSFTGARIGQKLLSTFVFINIMER